MKEACLEYGLGCECVKVHYGHRTSPSMMTYSPVQTESQLWPLVHAWRQKVPPERLDHQKYGILLPIACILRQDFLRMDPEKM